MNRVTWLGSVALLVGLGGCVRNHYVVELTPDGDGYRRQLTMWRENSSQHEARSQLPVEEVERIASLYEQHAHDADSKKHVFTGRFQGPTPADVGGAGNLSRWTSSLGALSVYIERFRGNDNLQADLDGRRAAADTLVDLLIGWFEAELGDQKITEDVRRFLDGDFRRDLKNLGVYGWTLGAVAKYTNDAQEEFAVRVYQYLAERGYVSAPDLPTLLQIPQEEKVEVVLAFLQRVLARKIGVVDGQPVPPALAFLADPNRAAASLTAYLRQTDFYQQQLAAWQATHTEQGEEKSLEPLDALATLLSEAVFEFQAHSVDAVEVRLNSTVPPYASNGEWDPEDKRVCWSQSLDRHQALPLLVYAAWSVPDEAAQTLRFGKVLLTGEALAQYVMWYSSLAAPDAAEWNRFLAELKAGPDLIDKLKTFRFSTDPAVQPGTAPDDRPASRADTIRQSILDRLENEAE